MMRYNLPGLAPACLAVAALTAAAVAVANAAPADVSITVDAHETLVTFDAPDTPTVGPVSASCARVVALPADTRRAHAVLVRGQATGVEIAGEIMRLRGQPVACVVVTGQGDGPVTVAVRHDGSWASGGAPARLASSGLHASLAGQASVDKAAALAPGGSYVIITAPAFQAQAALLADWKMRKGWPVTLVTTDETGGSPTQIQTWLQNAYDTWDRPPEYVLLMGDVAEIPSFVITVSSGTNATDMPFVLLDGDDWLPDAMIGRFPVSTPTEAQVVVAKTIAYDRTPYTTDDGWFTRSIMVAGNESSSTPTHTVTWCGEHLETIGFEPATKFLQPPLPPNANIRDILNPAIEAGTSVVAYRGWARADDGWATPRYLWGDFASLANDYMTPIVMSFVCETGNYGADDCFGEKFVTHGEPTDPPRGAVAFIGNTEGHSHTRHNDAMATSVFEQFVKPEVTSLGELMNTAKLRFIEFFPTELDVATYDELSVEFYFHIYNLLGDPELRFAKSRPTALVVDPTPTALAAGANYLEVGVFETNGTTPLAGARVGIVQNGALLGSASTDQAGVARLALDPVADGADVAVTVTHPGRLPHESTLTAGTAAGASLTIASVTLGDSEAPAQGNGDGLASPSETITLLPTVRNAGTVASGVADLTLEVTGPVAGVTVASALAGLETDTEGQPDAPFVVTVDPSASDGVVVLGSVSAVRGTETDLSQFQFSVHAPAVAVSSVTVGGDGHLLPGQTSELMLHLENTGSLGTTGGTITVVLETGMGASVVDPTAAFSSLAPGAAGNALDSVSVDVAGDTAIGTGLGFRVTVATSEGAVQTTEVFSLIVGEVDVSAPVGPDSHGYYAYDSADLFYPDQKPSYAWRELSTAYGGTDGTRIPFVADNQLTIFTLALPFPFTFYGEDYDEIRVSDNGWISFEPGEDSYNFYNWPMPNELGASSLVAPYWDNFNPVFAPSADDTTGLASDGVYWHHDATAGTYTVEWSRLRHYKSGIPGVQTFQVVLLNQNPAETGRQDDDMLFLYKQVSNSDYLRMYATVGIEDQSELLGLQLTYDNLYTPGMAPLEDGLAVRVTTEPPVYEAFRATAFTVAAGRGGLEFTWRLTDERPVTGWDVVAVDQGQRRRLNTAPLPVAARSFTAPGAPLGSEYVLVSHHPYGVTTEAAKAAPNTAPVTTRLALGPIAPNPVRRETAIAFTMPRDGDVRLRIFDVRGRCVRTLVDGASDAGETVIVWSGRDDSGRALANGVYFSRLEADGEILTRKLLLAR